MTSIFVFSFVMKKCIPQIMILFFSEFLDLKKYFLSTFLWIRLKQSFCIPKHLLKDSIGPHVDAVGPALGRQSVLQVYPPMSCLADTN